MGFSSHVAELGSVVSVGRAELSRVGEEDQIINGVLLPICKAEAFLKSSLFKSNVQDEEELSPSSL